MKASEFKIETMGFSPVGLIDIFNFSIKKNLFNKVDDLSENYNNFLKHIDKINQEEAKELNNKMAIPFDILLYLLEDALKDKKLDKHHKEKIQNLYSTLEKIANKLEDKATGFDKVVEKLNKEGHFKTLEEALKKKLHAMY